MKKHFFLVLWNILLLSSAFAQNIEEEKADADPDQVMNGFIIDRAVSVISEKDPSGFFMMFASGDTGSYFLPDIKNELGITDEQDELIHEKLTYMRDQDIAGERMKVFEELSKRFMNGNYEVSDEETAVIDSVFADTFDFLNKTVEEIYSAEQIQKMDGMILALSGGLASPLLNERHMETLEMTEEQKKQFAAINDEMKEKRGKMVADVTEKVKTMLFKGEVNVKYLVEALAEFREYSKELKKRRSAELTTAQISKVKSLSHLPKSLSVYNLLPKWMPDGDSWKPGDPLPEGFVPSDKGSRPFPREEKNAP